ncbi:hypothetical protein ACVNPS_01375 [Candidatus Bipolaricaulota sp. J31]
MIAIRLDEAERLEVRVAGRAFLHDPRILLRASPGILEEDSELRGEGWEVGRGADERGAFELWRRRYLLGDEPLGELRIRAYPREALIEFELRRDVDFLEAEDSFTAPVLHAPSFRFPERLRFLTLTFGLGGPEESYPGGYWPEFRWGMGPRGLPREAFAPLVIWDDEAAAAIAPANYPLTSPLVRADGGFARGLHGAVRSLPRGFILATWIIASSDPFSALRKLSESLFRHVSRVTRYPVLDHLGWWNAYGSYYTELLNPLDEGALRELARVFRERDFPLGYFGLDLWYRFRPIGKALRYQPDPRKYPSGLRKLRQELGVPYVLHLSALAEENEYGAAPGDPAVYGEIAEELVHHGAIAAWHDWLRTQQFLVRELRADPEAAERWFSGMLRAFAEADLPVVLCMQTVGMILASVSYGNVIAARSYTDYLFLLREALEEAARRGHLEMEQALVDPLDYRLQNLGVGAVYWTLGIRPFQDLFLTRENPDIGAVDPEGEAILRLLSLGPVGIGDRADHIDWDLLARLLDAEGKLLRPTAPPIPVLKSLDGEVVLFFSEVSLDGIPWGYLIALNTSEDEASVRPEHPADVEALAWDLAEGAPVRGRAKIPPRGMKVFLLAPEVHGVLFLGEPERLLPVHAGLELHADGGLWVTARKEGELVLFGARDPHVELKRGRVLEKRREDTLLRIRVSPGSTVRLRR